jgi:ribosomal protein L12E/L44/L45/RPP1/RPP2
MIDSDIHHWKIKAEPLAEKSFKEWEEDVKTAAAAAEAAASAAKDAPKDDEKKDGEEEKMEEPAKMDE